MLGTLFDETAPHNLERSLTMPNLKPGALALAIGPKPVLANMIAKVDALQDYMLVPIALAGAGLTLRAVKVILALHERGGPSTA
jgi:hypothetical protein